MKVKSTVFFLKYADHSKLAVIVVVAIVAVVVHFLFIDRSSETDIRSDICSVQRQTETFSTATVSYQV